MTNFDPGFQEKSAGDVDHYPLNGSFPIYVCNYVAMKVNGNGNLTNRSD